MKKSGEKKKSISVYCSFLIMIMMISMIRFISDYITHNHNHQMATNFYFYCLSCSCYVIHVFFYTYQCLSFIQVKKKCVEQKFFFFSFLALKISLYYPLFNGGFDTIYFLCTCLANIEFKKKKWRRQDVENHQPSSSSSSSSSFTNLNQHYSAIIIMDKCLIDYPS